MMKIRFGVDVGGTTIKFGLFSGGEVPAETWELPTRLGENGKYIFDDIAESLLSHTVEAGCTLQDVEGVGAGLPGTVLADGRVVRCINLGMRDVIFPQEMEARLPSVRTACGNDANLAALGEAWKGAGRGCGSMFMFTLGTGVGGGAVLDNQIIHGAAGVGGEIGHITVNFEEREACNCGNRGCLEQYASATGIVREARRLLAASQVDSSLRDIVNLTAKDVLDAARAGDSLALQVARQMGRYLAWSMSMVTMILDPEMFVIGGGVSRCGSFLIDLIREPFSRMIPLRSAVPEIRLAELGNNAGIYGAAHLFG